MRRFSGQLIFVKEMGTNFLLKMDFEIINKLANTDTMDFCEEPEREIAEYERRLGNKARVRGDDDDLDLDNIMD
jgi:hypothetical protein